jgi:hypothetical protein
MVVVLVQGGQSRSLRISHLVMLLFSTFRRRHDRIRTGLICWVVEERTNIVHKQWIQ